MVKTNFKFIFFLFVSQIICIKAYPQISDGISDASLTGLSAFNVSIGNLSPEVQKDGIKTEQLQKDVDLKLRTAGLRIINQPMWNDTLGIAELYIEVNTMKNKLSQYSYWINLIVIQKVSLMRPTIHETLASTWATSSMGIVGLNMMVETIRGSVGECVDKFIGSYLSVNPK